MSSFVSEEHPVDARDDQSVSSVLKSAQSVSKLAGGEELVGNAGRTEAHEPFT
ncbi:hypothetical protein [Azospirillum halopraeferens]|uniref:hypothetical protein n=1 Tax=Azospirillum halopraeferens TaxID=34010 RepID=UPI0012EBD120|nr:hypothetical protein [Azospirillum halopraeferens]